MASFPRFSPLQGRRSLWLREFSDTLERTIPNIIQTMLDYGYNCLSLKVMDGLSWVGGYDTVTPISDLTSLESFRDTLAASGIALLPVVVPRGYIGEGELHGSIAELCGCLMVDMEYGPGFWDQFSVSGIPVYWKALRASSGDAYLINEPDPRAYSLTIFSVLNSFDAVAAQHYVGWVSSNEVSDVVKWKMNALSNQVRIDWSDVDAEVVSYQRIAALGKDTFVTLWGLNRIDLAMQFWQRISSQAKGFCVFAMGEMDEEQLTKFGELPVDSTMQPIPGTDSVQQPTQGADIPDAQQAIISIRRELAGMRQQLVTLGSGIDIADTLAEHAGEDLNSQAVAAVPTLPLPTPKFTHIQSAIIGSGIITVLTIFLGILNAILNHTIAISPMIYTYIAIAAPAATAYMIYLIRGIQSGDWKIEMERRARWDQMRKEYITKKKK